MRSSSDLLRAGARLAAGTAIVVVVGVLAHVPLGGEAEQARLRLDLRTAIAHVEICRDLDPDELEALPIHMRRPRECRDVRPGYEVEVAIDGRNRYRDSIEPRGVRGNRPLTAEVELPLRPGFRHVVARFEPILPREASAEDRAAFARLPRFDFDGEVHAERGQVVLLTVDERNRRLRRVER